MSQEGMRGPSRNGQEGGGAGSILLRVNGQEKEVPAGTTVRGLLELLRLEPALVAVECNGEVVPRRTHDSVRLKSGDALEIVTFVGGD